MTEDQRRMTDSFSSLAFDSLDSTTLTAMVEGEGPSSQMFQSTDYFFTGPLQSVEIEDFELVATKSPERSSNTVIKSSDSWAAACKAPNIRISSVRRDLNCGESQFTTSFRPICTEDLTAQTPSMLPQTCYQIPELSSILPMENISLPSIRDGNDYHDDEAAMRTACNTKKTLQRVYKPRKVVPQHKDYVNEYTEFDVLCQRGARSNNHAGNQYYLRLVDDQRPLYRQPQQAITSTGARTKTSIVLDVIRAIHDRGGRFLEEDKKTKCWFVAPSKNISNKVAQALRGLHNDNVSRAAKRAKYAKPRKANTKFK
jgi:hypothetical protein